MATFAKQLLSGSTNGRLVKIVAVGTPGTVIHTAIAGATDVDEVWLWAVNSDTTDRKLTLEYGGVAAPDDLMELTVRAESGLVLVVPGMVLQNSLVIRAFAAAANVVMVGGFVNRITA
jgi:hypothetical protein